MTAKPLDIAIVVGELSGDELGYKLMRALRDMAGVPVHFRGVAGPAMMAEGMESLFPLDDIAVMGFSPVIRRFPTIYRRAWQVIHSVVNQPPDALIIIDSPDFTHAVAKRVRKRLPALPIIDYVSPSVWAWRPGRAARMRPYVDHLLALLPFEPAAHQRLGGPPCTYVGHPLVERLDELRGKGERAPLDGTTKPLLLVLPGSRSSEVERLAGLFGETVGVLARRLPPFELALPVAARQAERVKAAVQSWPVKPQLIEGEAAKFAAFRRAHAALAASGTVTLELALARVPMIGAYRVPNWEAALARRLVKTANMLLPNIILGERVIPELLQQEVTIPALADHVAPLLSDTPERAAQLAALDRVHALMVLDKSGAPSRKAAGIVLDVLAARQPDKV